MEFTIPWPSLLGGMIMGIACLLLLLFNGKIAGISGILRGLISPERDDWLWRLLFIIGMIDTGWLAMQIPGITFPETYNASTLNIILAGLLVGIGSGIGNGCTSGHGICGIGRFSIRSIAATSIFMVIAGITVFVRLHML